MCKILNISRSSYYQWLKRKISSRNKENQKLLELIRDIHESSHGIYGSPRIHAELRSMGIKCNKKRVIRIMKNNGIYAKTWKKYKITTKVNQKAIYSPNIIKQDFRYKKILNELL